MNTTSVFGAVMSLAVMFALISGSGVGAEIFGVEKETTGLDKLSEAAEENKDPEFSVVSAVAQAPFVGAILQFGDMVRTFVTVVGLLPIYLGRLGFPLWFATPIGVLAQLIASIGVFQVVTGREFL
ncbi:hypothetical protein [Halorubrum ezzemoulense]|uniref:Uncharacterized protein n=1 Tax=Halorubrum ezzemoulense TaxID=337243 RepID=A0A256J8P8_HALEZ|nr:hypothetical protein [Halorubrum ezzemoulense]OYR65175.1 hypothetical protein DJ80_02770 [Halorubrum ezzemoulense]